jgi:glycosyltransferase involved in cell wall biosynthesis
MVEAFEGLGHNVVMHALARSAARGEGAPSLAQRVKAVLPPSGFEVAAMAYNAVDYWRFGQVLRQERPDLVYKRHAMSDVGIVAAARRARIPLVLEVNRPYSLTRYLEFEPVRFHGAVRRFEAWAVNHASVVCVVSTPLADYLRPMMREPHRLLVTPNGANPARFAAAPPGADDVRHRHGLDGQLVIGWSGILREWHRVDLVIEALAGLPQAHLLIVGDGPDRERLEREAARVGVADRVHITGRVPHGDMPRHVAAMDIAVVADDRTGVASPMKLLEYMATSRPVVAPRMPNIQDLVTDGVDGVLFQQGSAAALRAALALLADDPERRRRLGEAARATIERARNWRAIAVEVLAHLGRVGPGV